MNRRWRPGPDKIRPSWLRWIIILAILAGLGWLYGARFWAIARLSAEVEALQDTEEVLRQNIVQLEQKLARANDPKVVEEEARRLLHWGFPGEIRVILIRR